MKIFFSLRHPFGLRNFEPVVRELAKRGCCVHISFLTGEKGSPARQADRLVAELPGCTYSELPTRKGEPWLALTRWLRFLADALRYDLPMYDAAERLRTRALRRLTPRQRRLVGHNLWRWPPANRLVTWMLTTADALVPSSGVMRAEIQRQDPDLVLVSPLVDFGSDQVDAVKAGRELGIRTALAVNSWDNLTNKGLIRILPERIFVWNDIQRREAIRYHAAAPDSVEATGAPIYDRWFDRRPSHSEQRFKRRIGLDPTHPYVLYLCSSPFIAPHEAEFVRRWLKALRRSCHTALRSVGVLIRPHPENRQPWRRLETERLTGVAVWPPGGASPVDDETASGYFDSIFHSRAVVGINSSGLIEAGIVGRPVFTILDPEFAAAQEGTIHFRYLVDVEGGLLRIARSWREHEHHLSEALAAAQGSTLRAERFLRAFVRPYGLDVEAAPRLAHAIIELAERPRPEPISARLAARLTRQILRPVARRFNRLQTAEARRTDASKQDPIRARVESLARSDSERIIVGPWLGSTSLEVVYWLPFVAWASELLGPDRLIAVSRGAEAGWYRGITASHLDPIDYFSCSELAAWREEHEETGAPLRARGLLDREIVRVVKQEFGIRRVRTLHPRLLPEASSKHSSANAISAALQQHRSIRPLHPLQPADDPPQPLSGHEDFIAWGLGPAGREVESAGRISAAIELLAQRGLQVQHVVDSDPCCTRSHEVAQQIRTLCSARVFVGSNSEHDLVPCQYGVSSLLLRSSDAEDLGTIAHACRVAEARGGASIEVCDPTVSDLVDRVLRLASRAVPAPDGRD